MSKAKAIEGGDEASAVVYVGRVPHGFHEHEMREYFTQFGTVEHVRLSRSKKTGQSKHYAFLKFGSPEVAKIAADTMNNYLLFGHILKCHVVPKEQVHDKMWDGADKRFKKVPWSKIEGRKLDLAKGRSEWAKKVEKVSKTRAAKQKKLKEIGYDFEVPELKGVEEIPVKEAQGQVTESAEGNDAAIEVPATIKETTVTSDGDGGVEVDEQVVTKKKRKRSKTESAPSEAEKPDRLKDAGVTPKKKSRKSL